MPSGDAQRAWFFEMKKRYVIALIALLALAGCSEDASKAQAPSDRASTDRRVQMMVDEYKIVSVEKDTPGHYEYAQRIGETILKKRRSWRSTGRRTHHSVSWINEQIMPLGFKLVVNEAAYPGHGQTVYDLVKTGGSPVKRVHGLQNIDTFCMNAAETSFLFVASQLLGETTRYVLVRDGQCTEWNPAWKTAFSPILLGESLMTVEKTPIGSGDDAHSALYRFRVKKDGEEVFEFLAEEKPTSRVDKRFFTWEGSWVIEYVDHVVIDGEDIGRARGYDAVYCYRIIDGEPFYFFEGNHKVHMAYAHQALPFTYDEVIHDQCCEPSHFNVRSNDCMVWFHARKGDHWYYVEAGLYPDHAQKPEPK